jgi:hypothetical protein
LLCVQLPRQLRRRNCRCGCAGNRAARSGPRWPRAVFAQQDAYGDAGFSGVEKAMRSLRDLFRREPLHFDQIVTIPTAYLPSLTSGSIYRQAATRKPSSITSAFMSQVDQKAAQSGIRSKSIPTPRPQARTGSISGPTSGTLFSAATPAACTLAQEFSASPGTPSATARTDMRKSRKEVRG